VVGFWLGVVMDSDGSGGLGKADAERFLLRSAEHLQEGIDYAAKLLGSRKVREERKMRWIRALTRQIEALVKVVEALNNIRSNAGGLDLASYLSSIRDKIEVPVEQGSVSESEGESGSVAKRRSCRSW
jgi:hypothetical protein